jgi:hypothetical protein
MQRPHFIVIALLLLACAQSSGSPTPGAGTDAGTTDGGETNGSTDTPTSSDPPGTTTTDPTTGGSEEEGSESASESGSETGGEPPLPSGICNEDGQCEFPETCSTCPDECGSCDVSTLDGQQAKYVDLACESNGDGSTDSCAGGDGQPGRFNDLQFALDSLVAGDTLYVHPGDYYQAVEGFGVSGIGTAEAPIVITAAVSDDPPVLHSFDPAAPNDNEASHTALGSAEEHAYVIIDNLRIDGLLWIGGDHTTIQNVECTHGWGYCDGNWSCLRLEYCTDCVVHHNYVHDVFDTTNVCEGKLDPRECGLKEFDSVRAVWEFNTVTDTERWGYDLHRSSFDAIARFNLFTRTGWEGGITMNRTGNMSAYGNVMIGSGTCVNLRPEDPGDGYANFIEHNTCVMMQAGIMFNAFTPTTVTGNVLSGIAPGTADLVIMAAPEPEDAEPHVVDYNAYDTSSHWARQMYEYPYSETLEDWQQLTGYDEHSIAGPGGACTFVDAPVDPDDEDFDLTIEEGPCATLSEDGGPVGACAITACVGHDCRACGY